MFALSLLTFNGSNVTLRPPYQRVVDHFVKLYKKKKGVDLRKDNRAVQKLRREVEKAKRALSSQHQVKLEIESLYDGEDFSETLTRARFEELNMVEGLYGLEGIKDGMGRGFRNS